MKKEFLIGSLISVVLHLLLILEFSFYSVDRDNTFSKREGLNQSRVSVRVLKAIKKKKVSKSSGYKKKKEVKKVKKSTKENGSSTASSGNQKIVSSYLSSIRSKIAQNRYRSRIAKRLKQKGRVVVSFTISNRNQISNINILRPSNSKQLNFSAIKTIEQIDSIPSIPKELDLSELTVDIEITYE